MSQAPPSPSPSRAVQLDLFLPLPDFSDVSLRDYQETMQRPFFSLAKNKRLKPIDYVSPDGRVTVHVSANPQYGMATIWDADILIFLASVVSEKKRSRANDIGPVVQIHPGHLLQRIGRDTSGRSYERLLQALDRLQSTTIKTNIRAGKRRETVFSWIDSYTHLVDEKTGRSLGMEISMSRWFYEGVLSDEALLSIDPAYFDITSGLGRWLYRVARKHAGGNGPAGFVINFTTLYEKSGSERQFRQFKADLIALARANALPEIHLEAINLDSNPQLRMVMRRYLETPKATKPSPTPPPASTPAPRRRVFADDEIDPAVLERIRTECPGWDLDVMKERFDQFIRRDPSRVPANYSQRFYSFMREHHRRNRHEVE